MGHFTRDSWDEKTLTMRDLDHTLCNVLGTIHCDDPRWEIAKELFKRVARMAEYVAREPREPCE